jgi:hypothetical protein
MGDPSEPELDPSRIKRRGGGGRLSRSETVTVRLDPKLRYLAELAARKQRRTLSSFIEWAIEESLKNVHLDDRPNSRSIATQSSELWDVDEPDRFAKLALRYRDMLTHDEQVLWKLVIENGYFWDRDFEGGWKCDYGSLSFGKLRQYWETLNSVAQGQSAKSVLPDWSNDVPRSPGQDMDDEIPF